MKKNNAKSIRISDFTLSIIDSMEGNGFNQKLEKLAYEYAQHESNLKKRIEQLERQETSLCERIETLSTMEKDLSRIKNYVAVAKSYVRNKPLEGQTSL